MPDARRGRGLVRFGICGSPTDLEVALAAGFDYVEYWAATQFSGDAPQVEDAEAANGFFTGEIRLFGAGANDWRTYAERTISNAARAGTQVMVVGSGNQRRHPDSPAMGAFVDVMAEIHAMGQRHGVLIGPESLNRNETNVGCSLGELAEAMGERGVPFVADSYHELMEWQADGVQPSLEAWRRSMPFAPMHVHIANVARDDVDPADPSLISFRERLREVGYDGRVTYEGKRGGDLGSLRALATRMRALFA